MQIKRVIAGGITALAAGATLALGAGAATLGDFVQVTGNTMTSPYIVIGTNAAAADTLAAADVGVALAGQATKDVAVPGAQGTMSVAGGALIQGEVYRLYVGTALSNANRKPDLTKEDLATVLAKGTVDQKTINDVDYNQYLSMGAQAVTWSKQSDWTEAALNLPFDTTTSAYTYKVVFQSGLDTQYVEGKEIKLLGKTFVFAGQDADVSNTSITLYAAGQTETVNAGSSTTVTVAGTPYVITVVGINTDGSAATVDVNGEAFDVDATTDNYVTKGDLNLYIKSIRAFKFPAESGAVQFFVGSEKLELDDTTNAITKGTDVLDGATVDFTQLTSYYDSGTSNTMEAKIYEIQFTFKPSETQYLKAGQSLNDGVFGAFKIAYGGIFPELTAASKDTVEVVKSSSTKTKLTFKNKAGNTCSMNVFSTDTPTKWSDGSYDIAVTNPSYGGMVRNPLTSWNVTQGNITEKMYFLVNRGYDSYILQYVSTDTTNNLVKLKDVCSGTTFDASTTTLFFYIGGYKYDFGYQGKVIRVNQTGGVSAEQVPLYTAQKAKLELLTATPGLINLTEAPFSTQGVQGATQVTLSVNTTLSSGEVDTIDIVNDATAMVSGLVGKDDTNYEYGVTASGTYAVRNTDADTLKIYTPAIPTPVYVAVGDNPVFSSGEGVSGGTVKQAVQIKNSVSKMESEVSTTGLDRDLVLLGGPCANGLVATLLNMSASRPTCGTEFTAKYPTEGVIKVVSNAFGSGKKALVVAGVDRTATRALAVKVMQGTVDYSA